MNATIEDLDVADILSGVDVLTYGQTTDKGYHRLVRYYNVTSYSQNLLLHQCPTKLLMTKLQAASGESNPIENIHFAFGHAVGAGVQSLWVHGNLEVAAWNTFLAWKIEFDARLDKKRKSIWEALIAVEKFEEQLMQLGEEWEFFILPNGKPGIEISFSLDCGNGYKHYGHIDVLLRNKFTGTICVLELKTFGLSNPEEALYANSAQALSYAVILDAIFPGITHYEVYHCAYSASGREWHVLPFSKSVAQKAEWIKDLLLDHATMEKYKEINFWPKRGESCFNYSQRCEFFGICNMLPDNLELLTLDPKEEAEEVDYALNLEQIVRAQQEKL